MNCAHANALIETSPLSSDISKVCITNLSKKSHTPLQSSLNLNRLAETQNIGTNLCCY
jgi:hypothetical protein